MCDFLYKYIDRLQHQYDYCNKVYEDYLKSSYTDEEKERVEIYIKNKKQVIQELIFDARNEIGRLKGSD